MGPQLHAPSPSGPPSGSRPRTAPQLSGGKSVLKSRSFVPALAAALAPLRYVWAPAFSFSTATSVMAFTRARARRPADVSPCGSTSTALAMSVKP